MKINLNPNAVPAAERDAKVAEVDSASTTPITWSQLIGMKLQVGPNQFCNLMVR